MGIMVTGYTASSSSSVVVSSSSSSVTLNGRIPTRAQKWGVADVALSDVNLMKTVFDEGSEELKVKFSYPAGQSTFFESPAAKKLVPLWMVATTPSI